MTKGEEEGQGRERVGGVDKLWVPVGLVVVGVRHIFSNLLVSSLLKEYLLSLSSSTRLKKTSIVGSKKLCDDCRF